MTTEPNTRTKQSKWERMAVNKIVEKMQNGTYIYEHQKNHDRQYTDEQTNRKEQASSFQYLSKDGTRNKRFFNSKVYHGMYKIRLIVPSYGTFGNKPNSKSKSKSLKCLKSFSHAK
jgi:hypothetical protein